MTRSSTIADKDSGAKLMVMDVEMLGMKLKRYKWKSCIADVGEGKGWATVYDIFSKERGKGHATELLKLLKNIIYKDVQFGGTVALNPAMKRVYEKAGVEEYDEYEATHPPKEEQKK